MTKSLWPIHKSHGQVGENSSQNRAISQDLVLTIMFIVWKNKENIASDYVSPKKSSTFNHKVVKVIRQVIASKKQQKQMRTD